MAGNTGNRRRKRQRRKVFGVLAGGGIVWTEILVSYGVSIFANLVFLTLENVFGPKNVVLGKVQEAKTSPEHLDQEGTGEDTA